MAEPAPERTIPTDRPAIPTQYRANEYMRDRPGGRFCSRCGAEVQVGQGTRACVCAMCLLITAGLDNNGYFNGQKQFPCKCGAERPHGKKPGLCDKCIRDKRRHKRYNKKASNAPKSDEVRS